MSDVLSVATRHDACVVLPTLLHATYWWPRVQDMMEDRQEVKRTKTSLFLNGSKTIVRLWVPYSLDPTMPMDFIHEAVFTFDYLLLWGLSRRRDVKWL